MEYLFGYPKKDELGETKITDTVGNYKDMLMDISTFELKSGDEKTYFDDKKETAILLLTGEITYLWNGNIRTVSRKDFFVDGAYCLHFSRNTKVTIRMEKDSEILVQQTENEREFAPVFYEQGNYRDEIFGRELCDNVAIRRVTTFFDYDNAPYSNMVCGEIMSNPGGWSSYIPHSHRQPEVYYYRFDHPNGFGACFIDDDVFKAKDKSFCAIPRNRTHPQVSAPGYRMYYVWMIRHLPNDPWTDRVVDKDHEWLKDKKDFIKIK